MPNLTEDEDDEEDDTFVAIVGARVRSLPAVEDEEAPIVEAAVALNVSNAVIAERLDNPIRLWFCLLPEMTATRCNQSFPFTPLSVSPRLLPPFALLEVVGVEVNERSALRTSSSPSSFSPKIIIEPLNLRVKDDINLVFIDSYIEMSLKADSSTGGRLKRNAEEEDEEDED